MPWTHPEAAKFHRWGPPRRLNHHLLITDGVCSLVVGLRYIAGGFHISPWVLGNRKNEDQHYFKRKDQQKRWGKKIQAERRVKKTRVVVWKQKHTFSVLQENKLFSLIQLWFSVTFSTLHDADKRFSYIKTLSKLDVGIFCLHISYMGGQDCDCWNYSFSTSVICKDYMQCSTFNKTSCLTVNTHYFTLVCKQLQDFQVGM